MAVVNLKTLKRFCPLSRIRGFLTFLVLKISLQTLRFCPLSRIFWGLTIADYFNVSTDYLFPYPHEDVGG